MQVVVVPVANMYSRPTEKADVVSQAIYGSNVKLLESRGEWSRIETADHYRGWTPSRYLRIILTGNGYATAGPTVQVESLFANIYAEPDVTKHKPVVTIPFEAKLEVVPGDPKGSGKGTSKGTEESHEGWLHVRLAGQTLAWIQASDVIAEPKPLTIKESIELAKRILGFPYLWGGRSSYGFDCAGFTQMLVRPAGSICRAMRPQAAWKGVARIEREKNLQAGDSLFWLFRETDHAYRDVHWRWSIHSGHHQWTSRPSNQPLRRRAVDAFARRLPESESNCTLVPLSSVATWHCSRHRRVRVANFCELPAAAAAAIALLDCGVGCFPQSSMTSAMRCVSCCMAICRVTQRFFFFAA